MALVFVAPIDACKSSIRQRDRHVTHENGSLLLLLDAYVETYSVHTYPTQPILALSLLSILCAYLLSKILLQSCSRGCGLSQFLGIFSDGALEDSQDTTFSSVRRLNPWLSRRLALLFHPDSFSTQKL